MSVNTIYGVRAQLLAELGIPYYSIKGSTLNEHLLVKPFYGAQNPLKYPKRKYVGVGIGGHKKVVTPHGVPIERHNLFEPEYSQLFTHIPYVVRTPDNDLTLEEKLKYRMRAVLEKNGVIWLGYFLRPIENMPTDVTITRLTSENGFISPVPFVHDEKYQSILDSQLRTIDTFNHETKTYDTISVSVNASLTFTADDVAELLNSINVLYGSDEFPILSELGMFAGIETSSAPLLPTDQSTYLETDLTILSSYTPIRHTLVAGQAFEIPLDLGSNQLLSRAVTYV